MTFIMEEGSKRAWGSSGGKWIPPLIDASKTGNAITALLHSRVMEKEGDEMKGYENMGTASGTLPDF